MAEKEASTLHVLIITLQSTATLYNLNILSYTYWLSTKSPINRNIVLSQLKMTAENNAYHSIFAKYASRKSHNCCFVLTSTLYHTSVYVLEGWRRLLERSYRKRQHNHQANQCPLEFLKRKKERKEIIWKCLFCGEWR